MQMLSTRSQRIELKKYKKSFSSPSQVAQLTSTPGHQQTKFQFTLLTAQLINRKTTLKHYHKMKFTNLFITSLLPTFSLALATPTPPGLSYLGHANISVSTPFPVGPGPFGQRNIFPIAGGNFTGPVFNATIPAFGGDWGLGDPAQGNFYVDARYQLHTTDGADIYVEANGPQQPDGRLHTRVRFEAGTDKGYGWLNGVVGVGVVTPRLGEGEGGQGVEGIGIEVWRLESLVVGGEGKGGE
ncbi:hypothetical protein B0T21DRAFT_434194 [Apiosordaria backusii]|uniref:Uncharacterized protein n=1 Tax=Apiosordaria backusii TaxID=314023 RepID=A0AA40EMU6_9PEZI|nr:hypothetical protein B0T21DRAFT_434194 [Apiosordaria backusii]